VANKAEQESFYEFHLNGENELMVSLRMRETEPRNPVLIYGGGAHALLYRTPESSVLLDFIHPAVRPYLARAKSVLVAETRDYQVVREYTAPCRQVKSLPVDVSSVKPLLDKERAERIDERDLYK